MWARLGIGAVSWLIIGLVVLEDAWAEVPLGEADVVRLAVEAGQLRERESAETAIDDARARAASTWANPELKAGHAQIFGATDELEQSVILSQEIEISGARGKRSDAIRVLRKTRSVNARERQLDLEADARLRYFAILHRRNRTEILEAQVETLVKALATLEQRQARGEASRYDVLRISREVRRAKLALAAERQHERTLQTTLAVMLGLKTPPTLLDIPVLPDAPPTRDAALAALERHPSLESLSLRRTVAELEAEAEARKWVPGLVLEGGWKGLDLGAAGRADGFIVGFGLSLPLFDQGRDLAESARQEMRLHSLEYDTRMRELESSLAEHLETWKSARDSAIAFRTEIERTSPDFKKAIDAGFAAGESSLLEWLDADSSLYEDQLTLCDLELQAREAQLEVDRLIGLTPR
jgi:cobalt-zinc-cadmium efflux system outer membrane protein